MPQCLHCFHCGKCDGFVDNTPPSPYKTCPNCGNDNDIDSYTCIFCGTPLEQINQPAPTAARYVVRSGEDITPLGAQWGLLRGRGRRG